MDSASFSLFELLKDMFSLFTYLCLWRTCSVFFLICANSKVVLAERRESLETLERVLEATEKKMERAALSANRLKVRLGQGL